MKLYRKHATEFTPEIDFDFEKKRLLITGVCAPENPILFFETLNGYIAEYMEFGDMFSIDIKFDYFNTGTSKCLLAMFKWLKNPPKENFQTEVNWYSDKGDLEMQESGEIFEELSGMKFNYLENEE